MRWREVAADRADDHEHEDAEPDLVSGCERAHIAHDELRPWASVTARARVSAAVATIRPAGARDDHGRRAASGSAVGTNAALRSRWRTSCAASATVATVRMSNAEPADLLEPGAQRRRQCGRPDDADLDAVRMRLVVRADDAGREHDHEEDGDEHGSQSELRLGALLVVRVRRRQRGCWSSCLARLLVVLVLAGVIRTRGFEVAYAREHFLLGDGALAPAAPEERDGPVGHRQSGS